MNKQVYLYVFDTLADWEPAAAIAQIRENSDYEIVSVGQSRDPIMTMGGLTILPDISMEDAATEGLALLILPGGDWGAEVMDPVEPLVRSCVASSIPVAAICGATTAIAKWGLFEGRAHTGNAQWGLLHDAPDYKGHKSYTKENLSVTSDGIISAGGIGYMEFACEIFRALNIRDEVWIEGWYEHFKLGKTFD